MRNKLFVANFIILEGFKTNIVKKCLTNIKFKYFYVTGLQIAFVHITLFNIYQMPEIL